MHPALNGGEFLRSMWFIIHVFPFRGRRSRQLHWRDEDEFALLCCVIHSEELVLIRVRLPRKLRVATLLPSWPLLGLAHL